MTPLPARDISEIHLSDLIDEPGCPLCRERARSGQRFIESFLWEGVNDVGLRRQLDEARGFCPPHTHALLAANRKQSGGTLASAILFGAVVRVRRSEIEAARAAGRRPGRNRVADLRRAPACPVCQRESEAVASALAGLLRLSADEAWAEALKAAPFCLDHLLGLMAHAGRAAGWAPIEAAQLERIAVLDAQLERLAHHSSEDRRHLLTDDDRGAADAAARLLGGDRAEA